MDPDIVGLRNQCLALANQLSQIQINAGYQGPDIPTLYATEMSLRTKVTLLNTAIVGGALAASNEAQTQLKNAIKNAQTVTSTIADVGKALQIAADLITLAGGVISDNPAAIIGAAAQTIADATAPAAAAPAQGN